MDQPIKNEAVLVPNSRIQKIQDDRYCKSPFNCIGFILSQSKTQEKAYASGFLITSCIVLTAGHTFYGFKKPSIYELQPQIFTMIKQINGDVPIKTQIKVVRYMINEKYKEKVKQIQATYNQQSKILQQNKPNKEKLKLKLRRLYQESQKYDYALIKLQTNVERQKYFSLKPLRPEYRGMVTVCGYLNQSEKDRIYHHSNEMIITPFGGQYDIDTRSGQSGSPVYLKDNFLQVVGIHKGCNLKQKQNVCCLITQEMLNTLDEWMFKMNLKISIGESYAGTQRLSLQQKQRKKIIQQQKQLKKYKRNNKQPYEKQKQEYWQSKNNSRLKLFRGQPKKDNPNQPKRYYCSINYDKETKQENSKLPKIEQQKQKQQPSQILKVTDRFGSNRGKFQQSNHLYSRNKIHQKIQKTLQKSNEDVQGKKCHLPLPKNKISRQSIHKMNSKFLSSTKFVF